MAQPPSPLEKGEFHRTGGAREAPRARETQTAYFSVYTMESEMDLRDVGKRTATGRQEVCRKRDKVEEQMTVSLREFRGSGEEKGGLKRKQGQV